MSCTWRYSMAGTCVIVTTPELSPGGQENHRSGAIGAEDGAFLGTSLKPKNNLLQKPQPLQPACLQHYYKAHFFTVPVGNKNTELVAFTSSVVLCTRKGPPATLTHWEAHQPSPAHSSHCALHGRVRSPPRLQCSTFLTPGVFQEFLLAQNFHALMIWYLMTWFHTQLV